MSHPVPPPPPPAATADRPWLDVFGSRTLPDWLAQQRLRLAFTTYQSRKPFFIGTHAGQLSVFERTFDRGVLPCSAGEEARFQQALPDADAVGKVDGGGAKVSCGFVRGQEHPQLGLQKGHEFQSQHGGFIFRGSSMESSPWVHLSARTSSRAWVFLSSLSPSNFPATPGVRQPPIGSRA